ncbi:MAG: hypothetical protein WAN36_15740, partial [Calditrichia bacterium]
IWLPREFIMEDEKQIAHIFRATARFITFVYHQYRINLKKAFLNYYEQLKVSLPRVVGAINQFISEYNVWEAILAEDDNPDSISGIYELAHKSTGPSRMVELSDPHFPSQHLKARINFATLEKLRPRDLIHLKLVKKDHFWEVVDIQFIYPSTAKKYFMYY